MNKIIGVDLGGTNIRVGLLTEEGTILEEYREKTEAHLGNEQIVEKITSMIKKLKEYKDAKGIGIGSPGFIDTKEGVVLSASNIGFENFPLKEELQKHFDLPIVIANDANVAALAEAIVGVGKGKNIVQYITISTGVGGGLIVNGQIVNGCNGCAGEIGNLIITNESFNHPILNDGSLELCASGTAVVEQARKKFNNINHAGDLFKLAKDGNLEAKEIYDKFLDSIAKSMSYIAHIVDPDIFIIGGGVSNSFELFAKDLEERYKKYIYNVMKKNVNIQKAKLNDPGIIGAAMLLK